MHLLSINNSSQYYFFNASCYALQNHCMYTSIRLDWLCVKVSVFQREASQPSKIQPPHSWGTTSIYWPWAYWWRIQCVYQLVNYLAECMLPTNKCRNSSPFLAYIITTTGSYIKSVHSQWSEPWLSCSDSGCGRPIHNLFIAATFLSVPETNLIFSDISSMSSIGWWVPFQCDTRLVCVYSSCQVLNWVRCESCRINIINFVCISNFTLVTGIFY